MLLVRGSNKALRRYGARGDVRRVAHHSPLPATYDGRTLRPTAPRGSEGQCPHLCREATERGWASNAHEAGVPSGGSLGRNLRSKTRWFTGFCNSHHVSHFATFFIDARAEISVAESRIFFFIGLGNRRSRRTARGCLSFLVFLGVTRAVFRPATDAPGGREGRGRWGRGGGERLPGSILSRVQRSCFSRGNDNDPSAGSPTETLLRLLLPLNDKVQWTSRDVTGGGPPASPRSEHFTGPFNR